MIKRASSYFCTSTFQLFAIIALAVSRNESADLYIDPQFKDAAVFAERIKEKAIFENVIVIDSKRVYEKYMRSGPGLKNHIQIANSYLHVKDIAETFLLNDVVYQNMFLSSKAYLPRMAQLLYIREGRNLNTFYFDDGAGSYEGNRAYKISKGDKILRKLLFGEKATRTDYVKYLFSPAIYRELNNEANNIMPISRVWNYQSAIDIFNDIFGVEIEPDIKERLIILDQPKDELFSPSKIHDIDEIYSMLVNAFGFDNVVVKKHPRSLEENFKNIKHFESHEIPFELYCMNMDVGNKIFVAHSSTAVATPKILFDQEPIVIVLSKLVDTITGEKNLFVDYFEAVRNTYRDKDRFIIPSNLEDLTNAIKQLCLVK